MLKQPIRTRISSAFVALFVTETVGVLTTESMIELDTELGELLLVQLVTVLDGEPVVATGMVLEPEVTSKSGEAFTVRLVTMLEAKLVLLSGSDTCAEVEEEKVVALEVESEIVLFTRLLIVLAVESVFVVALESLTGAGLLTK